MHNFLVDDGPVLTEHLKLIHQISWDLHLQTKHDLEDLFSEGCLQYLLKRRRFDDSKGTKFSSFIWIAIRNSLLDYIRISAKTVLIIQDKEVVPTKKYLILDVFQHKSF